MYKLQILAFVKSSAAFYLLATLPAVAQAVSDSTLPKNSLVISQDGTSSITGGTTQGGNLFHSFSQFSIPSGSTAYFNNPLDIQNIFSRVTGSSISNINGTIKANGTANLFLINPNGILFGPNSQLNIGGSFLGSTANSINFADGTQFSATASQNAPLLTLTVPVGLGLGSNSGEIRVQSTGHNLIGENFKPVVRDSNLTGLRVQSGKTLAIVGGSVVLEGGVFVAPEGRIELGSVDTGVVNINSTASNWVLSYESAASYKNIDLSSRSLLDASGTGSGSIQVQGRQVKLADGSVFLIQNRGLSASGMLAVNTSNSLEISGTDPIARIPGSLWTETLGSGVGGDIKISTPKLNIVDGGLITTTTYNTAKAGNIILEIPESIQILGASPRSFRALSSISSLSFGSGLAGDISVLKTRQFTARNGGLLISAALGSGGGGDVTVNATDFVELLGVEPRALVPSAISAATGSSSNAGRVTINTSKLILRGGGRVDSSTIASGAAGTITINASDSVDVEGTAPNSLNPSLIISSANILDERFRSVFSLPGLSNLTGTSGDIAINTSRMNVSNSAQITSRNDGTGNAGTLEINANSIDLDNSGSLNASTNSGEGGNIFLSIQNLQLRHNSSITASAGGIGNGGNIEINTGTLAALENSDISANSTTFRGGRVTINTQGIFGTQFRNASTTDSDITATGGQPEFDGVVDIRTLGFDVTDTLTPLAANLASTEQIVANSCLTRRNSTSGSFVVTGSGGLPTNPLSGIEEWEPLSGVQPEVSNIQRSPSSTLPISPKQTSLNSFSSSKWKIGDTIIEAQGIVKTANGRLLLGMMPQGAAPQSAEKLVCSAD